MPANRPLVLIIDGNNLAHHLDTLPAGNPVSTVEIERMAIHLGMYLHAAQRTIVIELCLDHLPPDHHLPVIGGLQVFPARGETADALLLERFRFHHHQGHPCLVITNDREVCDEVGEEGGETLFAYHFVRRVGKKPVFRDPRDFETLVRRGAPASVTLAPAQTPQKPPARASAVPLPPKAEVPLPEPLPEPPAPEPPAASPTPPAEIALPYAYRLTLETWPLEAGVRFLLASFCPQHGAEYHDFREGPFVPGDVRSLASALIESCGQEPGFAARGSLLDRVRLALLLSPDEAVPLAVIAERTGLSPLGLHGRIKEKARGWLKIV